MFCLESRDYAKWKVKQQVDAIRIAITRGVEETYTELGFWEDKPIRRA